MSVTIVDVTPKGIILERDGKIEGKITTSMTRGPSTRTLKKIGLSAIMGLAIGSAAWARINNKAELSVKKWGDLKSTAKVHKKQLALVVALVTLISILGMTFYESKLFNVRYSYHPGFQVTSKLFTSVFRRNRFKIRKMGKTGNHKNYTVEYIDAENFVLKNRYGFKVFTTVGNKNYTFEQIDREDIGKYMPMLKHAQLSIKLDGNQVKKYRDLITLAATLTYLHRKVRPVHIIGGLKLLQFTIPLVYLMKNWLDIEKMTKDKSRGHPLLTSTLKSTLGTKNTDTDSTGTTDTDSQPRQPKYQNDTPVSADDSFWGTTTNKTVPDDAEETEIKDKETEIEDEEAEIEDEGSDIEEEEAGTQEEKNKRYNERQHIKGLELMRKLMENLKNEIANFKETSTAIELESPGQNEIQRIKTTIQDEMNKDVIHVDRLKSIKGTIIERQKLEDKSKDKSRDKSEDRKNKIKKYTRRIQILSDKITKDKTHLEQILTKKADTEEEEADTEEEETGTRLERLERRHEREHKQRVELMAELMENLRNKIAKFEETSIKIKSGSSKQNETSEIQSIEKTIQDKMKEDATLMEKSISRLAKKIEESRREDEDYSPQGDEDVEYKKKRIQILNDKMTADETRLKEILEVYKKQSEK
jgi:hypothetical protein